MGASPLALAKSIYYIGFSYDYNLQNRNRVDKICFIFMFLEIPSLKFINLSLVIKSSIQQAFAYHRQML